MMKSMNKKRKRSSRFRGSHTHGKGFMKKARGSGHRGGFGMAGTGKRADHKKTWVLNLPYEYFGGSPMNPKPRRYEIINIEDIEKIANGKKDVDLSKYKILGRGEIKIPLKIKATNVSKSAREKIEKVGGEIILPEKKEEIKKVEKKEIIPTKKGKIKKEIKKKK